MLDATGHRALYSVLKAAASVLEATPATRAAPVVGQHGVGPASSQMPIAAIESLRSCMVDLVSLLLDDLRSCIQDAGRASSTSGQRLLDGAASLYEATFHDIALFLLHAGGRADDVQRIAEDHVHFQTLFEVVRHIENTRGRDPAQVLMQSYLDTDRIRCDERGDLSFPQFVYHR